MHPFVDALHIPVWSPLLKTIGVLILSKGDRKPEQPFSSAKHRRKFFAIELDENTLLLCSDGLTIIALSDEEIREVIIFSKTEDVCKKGCAGKI